MRVWGLTGNIGSGKSTVARLLRERGVPVVDADLVAREIVEAGKPAFEEIARRFPGVIQGGVLDRKALGARVFNDPAERAALEAITWPRIAAEVARRIAELADAGRPFAVYEAALIVENGLHHGLDGLVVVTAPEGKRIERLRARDALSDDDIRARLAAQLPESEKVKLASFVIDNGGPPEALLPQVERLLEKL